ncbi:hypothetical protein BKA63DRAFT_126411 [Paraphoma chrysanthemicola]|nr:hypothetical protein BKA63DRAFT_126411 [Paraphoma chrysanthemicola]
MPYQSTRMTLPSAVGRSNGWPYDDFALAFSFVEELNKHPVVRFNQHGDFHFGMENEDNRITPEQLPRMCAALYNVLTRQYFRRAWILQEVAWATTPTVLSDGKLAIQYGDLDMAAYHLHDLLTRDPALIGQIEHADPSISKVNTHMLAYPRKVFYFRYLLSRGNENALPFHKFKSDSPGYLEVLVLTRDFECTDPVDRIFALWNLAQDKAGLIFTPSYGKAYEEVYADFTRAWSLQHGALDILGAVEMTPQSIDFYERSPSWCPNWNAAATAGCLVRKDYLPTRFMSALDDQDGKLYSADGDVEQGSSVPWFTFETQVLHCTGLILDQITIIFDDAPDIPAGTAPKSTWRFHHWTDALQRHYQRHELGMYDDPLRAAWAMFHGDSIAAWPPVAESGYDPQTYRPNEPYVCLPALSRHVLRFAGSFNRTEAWSVVDTVLRGRRPFVTENGYMGLSPAYISEENKDHEPHTKWQLAIVVGCSVPLLLREREDGTYQLVGSCFVQGWMDGEWLQTMMGSESAKDCWEALRDGAKLVIT